MKALSIRQPWADLIIRGIKDVENRSWSWRYRGRFAVHTSKTFDFDAWDSLVNYIPEQMISPADYITGAIIGIVEIVDCVEMSESWWFTGPFGFILKNPQMLIRPVPYQGKPYPFDVPAAIFYSNLKNGNRRGDDG